MLVALMIGSTIVAPSIWAMGHLIFIYFVNWDPKKECTDIQGRKRRISTLKRFICLPLYLSKFSMSIVYVNSILLVATSNVRFAFGGDYSPDYKTTNVNMEVGNGDYLYAETENATRGGMIAFIVGIIFSTGALMIFKHLMVHHETSENVESTLPADHLPSDSNGDKTFMSPPPTAFQIAPNFDDLQDDEGPADLSMNESTEEDFRDLSTSLMPRRSQNGQLSPGENEEQEIRSQDSPTSVKSTKWLELLEFEAGATSFLLALPLLNQPLIELRYSGILTPIFNENAFQSYSLTLMEIINVITKKGGEGIFPLIASSFLWINVILVPACNWFCCTSAWALKACSNQNHVKFCNIAKLFHPLSHMTPFVLSVFASLASLEEVSNFLFNENKVCGLLKDVAPVDEFSQCLRISAKIQPFLIILLIQSVATDIFVHTANPLNYNKI